MVWGIRLERNISKKKQRGGWDFPKRRAGVCLDGYVLCMIDTIYCTCIQGVEQI